MMHIADICNNLIPFCTKEKLRIDECVEEYHLADQPANQSIE